jgi:flagellar hook-associated protein 3 FlgL
LFATVQGLVDTLGSGTVDGASRALLHNQVGQLMVDLDQAMEHVIDIRSEIGARLQALDQESELVDGFTAQLTETLSDLRDLDYAEALSLLAQQLFGLEAAQQSYARTQNLSLFRFL